MINQEEISEIEKTAQELLLKMTITDLEIKVTFEKNGDESSVVEDIILVNINLLRDPQFLIGKDGQTLFDLQKVLRAILNRKIKKSFYLKLDINDYQKQKIEYLKKTAKLLADEVALNRESKSFPPMPAYERRIIHEELAGRQDVIVKSDGEGNERRITISAT